MPQPVFRFAPSPNGRLHLGHAYSALLNESWARRVDGRLLLRIEDIDTARCRPEFERSIHEDLAWLGLKWEKPVRRQSEHFEDYRHAFKKLRYRGLPYPCFCSRKEIAVTVTSDCEKDPDGTFLYGGGCRNLTDHTRHRRMAAGDRHSWRLDMTKALRQVAVPLEFSSFSCEGVEIRRCSPGRWGDPIIVRKEIPTSYHLSVVLDDALQGVTHIVRGNDLEAATDLHVLLQKLLDLPTPRYLHHGLILGGRGEKLSKSLGSEALSDLRLRGVSADTIRRELGFASY